MENRFHALSRPATRDLTPYVPGLSAEHVAAVYGVKDIAKLASNENPFASSDQVREALEQALGTLSLYPDPQCLRLRALLAESLQVAPERLVFGNGSEDLIACTARGFLDDGDRIAISTPTFPVYADCAIAMKGEVVDVPRRADLTLDVDAVCKILATGPKILFLCNPNNPTGTAVATEDFERICKAADERTLVVVDEAYYEYARGPGHPESLEILPRAKAPWLVLRTFSKAYGLAGLRIGYGIASDPLIVRQIDLMRTAFNVNGLAQTAACAAWSDRTALERAVQHNALERERVSKVLSDRGLALARSAANFLFLDTQRSSRDLAEELMRRGVIVRPWGGAYPTWIRVSLGTRAQNDRFLEALAAALDGAPADRPATSTIAARSAGARE